MAVGKSRQRRSAEQTRALMIEHGQAQLERDGVHLGLEHLTLEAVCAAADVARSSSHSAWSGGVLAPQACYQRAVIERWIHDRKGDMFARSAETTFNRLFEERDDEISRSELIRTAVHAAAEIAVAPDELGKGSGFLSTDMALKHALASQPPDERDPDIAEWVRVSEIEYRELRIRDTYRPMAALLGLVPRPQYGDAAFDHVALVIAALLEGITLRQQLIPELGYVDGAICDGDDGPYTLLTVSVLALIEQFFEPTP